MTELFFDLILYYYTRFLKIFLLFYILLTEWSVTIGTVT
ncbi:hypothetical protein P7266_0160 [Lactococcus cremoris]|nr:hypothetical protein P7266_0160 [Lactococcus cremoris]